EPPAGEHGGGSYPGRVPIVGAGTLKLGLNTGYWGAGPPHGVTDSIAEAEKLGFDSIWTAEAYGSDALTPLAWWGASTSTGRLGLFCSPHAGDLYRDSLTEGFGRPGARRGWDDFEVCATVPLIVHDDVEAAADMLRPMYALYFGGMGAKAVNFHANVPIRMG